ncbi:YodL-like [Sarcina sp. DSM 11001]|uniref:YodL domain-containing protein n=1 Tax=Sarcina sp. DSM 11001 TaxID=1798184 RepID=UPI00088A49BF|nr:YodL domain-containing protein [Sarcina sp. DSM 11001]SDL82813.1 YodL-like [Sarcina sp. DSM 11001]
MSGPVNQFSVYRLRRDTKETRTRRHQSYAYLQQYGLQVRSDYYDQLYLSEFDPETTEMELRRRLGKDLPADASGDTLAVGDVLAITREGITEAFYADKQSLVPLKGFFHVASSSGLLTMDTRDYQIEGRAGNWFAAEETWIDGHHFLLMQSQKHGTNAAYAVLDSRGHIAAEDTYKGFTPETVRQIREYVKRQEEGQKATEKPPEEEPESGGNEKKGTDKRFNQVKAPEEEPVSRDPESPKSAPADRPVPDRKQEFATIKKRRRKKRRKGKVPMRLRKSVLERLRRYQAGISKKRENR